jgi:cell division protein FtsI/penicillin-binding protein 2
MVVHNGSGGYRNTGTAYAYIAMNEALEYRMAGKSGTAQVVGMAEDFDNNAEVAEKFRDHALFISFAPVENPQIALAVFIEHGVGGSSIAGPIAREIIDAYLLEDGELKPEFIFPQISEESENLTTPEVVMVSDEVMQPIASAQQVLAIPQTNR